MKESNIIEDRLRKFKLLNSAYREISPNLLAIKKGDFERVYNIKTGKYLDGVYFHDERIGNNCILLFGTLGHERFKVLTYTTGEIFHFKHNIRIFRCYLDEIGIDIVYEYHIDPTDRDLVRLYFLDIKKEKIIGTLDINLYEIDIDLLDINKGKMICITYTGNRQDIHPKFFIDKTGIYT